MWHCVDQRTKNDGLNLVRLTGHILTANVLADFYLNNTWQKLEDFVHQYAASVLRDSFQISGGYHDVVIPMVQLIPYFLEDLKICRKRKSKQCVLLTNKMPHNFDEWRRVKKYIPATVCSAGPMVKRARQSSTFNAQGNSPIDCLAQFLGIYETLRSARSPEAILAVRSRLDVHCLASHSWNKWLKFFYKPWLNLSPEESAELTIETIFYNPIQNPPLVIDLEMENSDDNMTDRDSASTASIASPLEVITVNAPTNSESVDEITNPEPPNAISPLPTNYNASVNTASNDARTSRGNPTINRTDQLPSERNNESTLNDENRYSSILQYNSYKNLSASSKALASIENEYMEERGTFFYRECDAMTMPNSTQARKFRPTVGPNTTRAPQVIIF